MFKELGNLANLLKNSQGIGTRFQELQERLRSERFQTQCTELRILVEMNGLGELLRLRIDSRLMEGDDPAHLERLIPEAVNLASKEAKRRYAEAVRSMVQELGLPIPGLDKMLAQLT